MKNYNNIIISDGKIKSGNDKRFNKILNKDVLDFIKNARIEPFDDSFYITYGWPLSLYRENSFIRFDDISKKMI